MVALACLAGCGWLSSSDVDVRRSPVEDLSARPPEQPTSDQMLEEGPGDRPLEDQSELSDDFRPANPQSVGEAGRIAVGRRFEPVYFDAGAAELDSAARSTLSEYAQWLGEHPRVWITLQGFCDAGEAEEFGLNLGMARSQAACEFLTGMGLPPARRFTISFGRDRLVVEAPDSPDALVMNNRLEFDAFYIPEGKEPARVPAGGEQPPAAELSPKAPPIYELPRPQAPRGAAPEKRRLQPKLKPEEPSK